MSYVHRAKDEGWREGGREGGGEGGEKCGGHVAQRRRYNDLTNTTSLHTTPYTCTLLQCLTVVLNRSDLSPSASVKDRRCVGLIETRWCAAVDASVRTCTRCVYDVFLRTVSVDDGKLTNRPNALHARPILNHDRESDPRECKKPYCEIIKLCQLIINRC